LLLIVKETEKLIISAARLGQLSPNNHAQ